MQTRNPFLDEIGKAVENAMGMAQSAGEEAKAAIRAQGDRMATELDLVRRDEFEAMRAVLSAQIAELRAELAKLNVPDGAARPSQDGG
jgi:BMFP domain-containing protein YqiC